MPDYAAFFITLAIGIVFGTIGWKLKIPMGPMLGAMLSVAAFNIFFEHAYFYNPVRIGMQIFTGAMIGSRVLKKDLPGFKQVIFPTLILLVSMIVINIFFGTLIYRFSDLNVATALFAITPGGAGDMAIISSDLGADPAIVAIMQIFRLVIVFTTLPSTFKYIAKKRQAAAAPAVQASTEKIQSDVEPDPKPEAAPVPQPKFSLKEFLPLLLSACVGGLLFQFLGVTAGAMIGAMLFGISYNIFRGPVYFPGNLKTYMQIFAGTYIGSGITKETVASLDTLIIPLLLMACSIMLTTFGVSFIVRKLTKLDYIVSLLSCAPGGMQEMALLSEEIHSDTPKVAIMQTLRFICVIVFFPITLEIICGILS